ncbi:hybrid sensor histidine kinase/response regulator [Leptolyngbya sp. KIOST-1]|uniref:hybrid sensor histidine kinase/response regulator n=1 Tax=Leptolyngbya sp. KIOST-1 TaxID=1229172 RepID=UPI0005664544|nr:hybrid sensor histidine kinase/response regulator [Leptolyngbya sp. KIOST-1]
MNPLRFLLLEDNPLDAEVVKITLLEGGIDCDVTVVDTQPQFEAALAADPFDLILADFALAGFDGLTALTIAQQKWPDVPFILVSGSLGEELAIESLKRGATDYVLKQRLERLMPCLERALREAQERRERQAAQRERQIAAAALQESEDRLRLAIAAAHLGTWDWDLTTNRLTWDAGCKATFGLPPDAETSIDVFFAGLHPDDRDRLQQLVTASLDPVNGGNYDTEFRTIGIQDQVERWLKAKGQVYFDPSGTPFRFIGTVLDITAQKRAEAIIAADLRDTQLLQDLSLRLTSEENVQVLYDETVAAAVALMQADAGTIQILEQDTQAVVLLASQGLAQETVDYFYRLDATSHTACGIALATGERAIIDYDVPIHEDPDGSLQRLVEAGFLCGQSTPLISRWGRAIGIVSTHWRDHHCPRDRELRLLDLLARQVADLIEQRQAAIERNQLLEREQAARAEAEGANRVKDEFLAILSHELRSPLNPILGWSKLLQGKTLDAAKTQQGLSTIERNARLQTQLIDDLLDVARILRGKLTIEATTVNLATMIEAALEVVRYSAEAKQISLQFDRVQSCEVRGDEGRLQQVVWNLLSNAIKFTPAGGQVCVRLATLDNQAQITVTDTGKGIRRDFIPHLFQAFRQEDISITRQYGGLGLGLSIVKYLVDAHGGTIVADSPGDGLGATFTVQIPLGLDQSPRSAIAPAASDPLDVTGVKVLAVDDSRDALELLAIVLGQYGAEVAVAASGSEALDSLPTFQPDVLICDIGMPTMNGYELIQRVRSLPDEQGRNVPAIAVTAFARQEDRQRALDHGFQHHIPKPIEPERVVRAIAQLAAGDAADPS